MACPVNSIRYNRTLCSCAAGYFFNQSAGSCVLFTDPSVVTTDSGIDYYAVTFPGSLAAFDSIRKFTQSQAAFLEATLFMLVSWLFLCFLLRFTKLKDGKNVWFKIRWWISRLDICFATRHWLDDQKVVKKRKTELGGTFSIASWILFIGLFAALLYQIISKRTIEVHNVRATNGPELASFLNDMEFNITTISSMSCSNLRDLGTLVTGTPGTIDYRTSHLSTIADYSCHNTSKGPTISLKCSNCKLAQDHLYISWTFVDLPNNPATAVGFEFNLTAVSCQNKRHMSFVSGVLKNGSSFDDTPVTFRGTEANILKFNLFPQIYHNLHDLKLIQPLFHEFLPGSSFGDITQLQGSLESTYEGLLNTTLYINLLSAYIVEIDHESIMGPVSFLADLGGLYCISIGIFFYLLVQCEYRIKRLRNEDSILRSIRNRHKAQERWDKLRKYVMYTWGCNQLDDEYYVDTMKGSGCSSLMIQSVRINGSSRKRRPQSKSTSMKYTQKLSTPDKKQYMNNALRHPVGLNEEAAPPQPCKSSATDDNFIPRPPSLELKDVSKMDMSDVQKTLRSLYEYNVMLQEKLEVTHSLLTSLSAKSSSHATNNLR